MANIPQNVAELSAVLYFAQTGTVSYIRDLCHPCRNHITHYHFISSILLVLSSLITKCKECWAEARSVAMVSLLVYDVAVQYSR